MDGLECSEISFTQIQSADLRTDAEYYSKYNLKLQEVISSIGRLTIAEHGGNLDCSAFYPSITGFYSNDRNQVPFLRVNEIVDGLIVISENTVFLPMDVLKANSKTIALAYPGDVIIAKGGNTLAKVGLVTDEYPVYATCRDVIILRTDELREINKYYLWAFLHSTYGQGLLWRSASQTGQPHLTLPSIMNIRIPAVEMHFQEMISELYEHSVELKEQSVALFTQAQEIVRHQLKWSPFPIEKNLPAVRSFSNSVKKTGRMDAEYYQVKYDAYMDLLPGNLVVETMCNLYDGNFTPELEQEYKYIELANVGLYGEITGVTATVGAQLPSRARRIVHAGQVIVSSLEGSLQSCALVTEEYDGALCSTGFYVLDSNELNSETLLMLVKSELIQELMKQRCSGSIMAAITKDELLRMPFLQIESCTQKQIAELVKKSFELRQQSKRALEYAKEATERLIENGVTTATTWLEERLGEIIG